MTLHHLAHFAYLMGVDPVYIAVGLLALTGAGLGLAAVFGDYE